MRSLDILRTRRFIGFQSVFTGGILALSLVFTILGFTSNLLFQSASSTLTIIGTVFLFGQILIALNIADRKERFGRIIIRFAYVALVVAGLGLLSIMGSTFLASFYLLGGNTPLAASAASVVGFTLLASFGICFSAICYHTLSIDGVWTLDE